MEEIVKSLSPRAEFVLVVILAFGYLIFGSLVWAIAPGDEAPISEDGLQSLIVYEAVILGLLAWFLRLRGWTVERLTQGFFPRELWVGCGLAVVVILGWSFIDLLVEHISPNLKLAEDNARLAAPGFTVGTVLFASGLNALFEEIFVCGYVLTALRELKDEWYAINLSVAIRLLYHLYQGPVGIVAIIPYGLFCAIWYARTRRLWPLVVAHALLDILALLASNSAGP